MNKFLAIAFLSGCGTQQPPPKRANFHPSYVDYMYRKDFFILADYINEELGYEALSVQEDSHQSIQVLSADNQEFWSKLPPGTIGATQNRTTIILLPVETVSTKHARSLLAHELGHALGLVHSDHGLMAPIITDDCENIEGPCLLDALRDQGLAPQ